MSRIKFEAEVTPEGTRIIHFDDGFHVSLTSHGTLQVASSLGTKIDCVFVDGYCLVPKPRSQKEDPNVG